MLDTANVLYPPVEPYVKPLLQFYSGPNNMFVHSSLKVFSSVKHPIWNSIFSRVLHAVLNLLYVRFRQKAYFSCPVQIQDCTNSISKHEINAFHVCQGYENGFLAFD